MTSSDQPDRLDTPTSAPFENVPSGLDSAQNQLTDTEWVYNELLSWLQYGDQTL